MHGTTEATTWDPFPPKAFPEDGSHRRAAYRAIAVSAFGLAVTGAIELAISLMSGSVGLLGDALHNLSDVSTSVAVFVGFRFSQRQATRSHPYGYDRAEDLAGLAVAAVIWLSAAFALVISVHKLVQQGATTHVAAGVVGAAIGIVGNQVVAVYKRRVGRSIQSATLVADARHSWLDAVASGGAMLGLIGVAAGFRWADGVAGLVVSLFIVRVGWEVTAEMVGHLMDGVEPDLLVRAEEAALELPGIEHVHVRARWSGRTLIFDVEGFVVPRTTLADAERLGERVERAIVEAVPEGRAVLWSPHALPG